jgi:hypothetical protein
VNELLALLYEAGDLTEAEYQEALTAPLVFTADHAMMGTP